MTRKDNQILSLANNSLWDLPSPSSMSYFWNFGSTLGLCLMVQMLSGMLLTFHYSSSSLEAFSSIVQIMREVWSGWLIRLIHMNGASMFFLFVYLHMFRGLYFYSSTHKKVWNSGVIILLTLMAISFLGYVLPWGQMSYWAVAVITNLFSVIPIVGPSLVTWIWGGFSVSSPTLTRFFSLHFVLPFFLTVLVTLHLLFLHKEGSSSSIGVNSNLDKLQFHPYFSVKDLLFIMGAFSVFMSISFYAPYLMGDPVNNVPANAMQTPIHIQPEWYFLPSYAILRALPSKTAGVLALVLSVTIFLLLPLYEYKFSTKFSFTRISLFWFTVFCFLFLMKMGSLPAEEPYIFMSKVASMLYFSLIFSINM
uniref:Cytochrome b n=1 Tax=Leipothrix sp. 1 XFX-2017 TaxID=1955440 RepID=A0A1S5XVZ1_9ACAR|nr:cytochrome b [Leipothrix sp. 1 XFX-2017]